MGRGGVLVSNAHFQVETSITMHPPPSPPNIFPYSFTAIPTHTQNYTSPLCVSWDHNTSNWMQNGCKIAVDENGIMEKDGNIINCTCDHLGTYGVYVVSLCIWGRRFGMV